MEQTSLDEHLRRHGKSVTRARSEVWDVLTAATAHLTADEIAALVEDTNRASVYRSLALFAELGLARESQMGPDEAARWELAHPDEHFHLICENCGDIDHHVGDLVEQIRAHLAGDHAFDVRHVALSVRGLCRRCAS